MSDVALNSTFKDLGSESFALSPPEIKEGLQMDLPPIPSLGEGESLGETAVPPPSVLDSPTSPLLNGETRTPTSEFSQEKSPEQHVCHEEKRLLTSTCDSTQNRPAVPKIVINSAK